MSTTKQYKCHSLFCQIVFDSEKVNNILIIGITGNGKSALANALSNSSDENKFGEGNSAISQTKDSQKSSIFEWQGKEYCVIDNIGFGDTDNIPEEEILLKIGEGIHAAKEGLNQVLFVFGGRFGPEHVSAYNKFKSFISESEINKYTTIIRTNFPNFRNEEKCEEDRQDLLSQNGELVEIINSCNGVIHIDNPFLGINQRRNIINKEKRKESREKVLNHLVNNCSETFLLKSWNDIYQIIDEYVTEKQLLLSDEKILKELNSKTAEKIKNHLSGEFSLSAKIEFITNK